MKKILAVMLVLAVVLFALSGCSNGTSSRSTFKNKYGTATTKCAHSGCNNYIASSGDTNCCAAHSNKCLECGKYIDEDAMYCMSCITNAASGSSSDSGKSSSHTNNNTNSGGKSTGTGAGGYDMPNENDKSFADYVKRVDPELYDSLFGD